MRLRRKAGDDYEIEDRNNGYRHEHAFVKNIRRNGLLNEADLLPDSYGGKFNPRAVPELISALPIAAKALARGKMTPRTALGHPHKAPEGGQGAVRRDRGPRAAGRAEPVRDRLRGRAENDPAETAGAAAREAPAEPSVPQPEPEEQS